MFTGLSWLNLHDFSLKFLVKKPCMWKLNNNACMIVAVNFIAIFEYFFWPFFTMHNVMSFTLDVINQWLQPMQFSPLVPPSTLIYRESKFRKNSENMLTLLTFKNWNPLMIIECVYLVLIINVYIMFVICLHWWWRGNL